MQRTILSVADYELKCQRPLSLVPGGPFSHTFTMPPVEKGKYALLHVDTMYSQYYMVEKNWNNGVPETADAIVSDLVKTWTGNTTDPPPGVIAIKGNKPTQEEIDRAMTMHNTRCMALRTAAHDMWATGDRKLAAQEQYKRASIWLGFMSDPWVQTPKVTTYVSCPWCRKEIDAEAAVCPECNKIANFDKYKELEAAQERMLASLKPAPIPPPPASAPTMQPIKPPVGNPQHKVA